MTFPRYGSVSKPIVPLVNIKIAGKWMFIPLKMVLIGIDPYPYGKTKAMFQTTNQSVATPHSISLPSRACAEWLWLSASKA